MINLVANCDWFNSLKLFTARSYTYKELISNNSSPTSWYPFAQQVLGERITADMQAHNSCCAAEDIGISGLYR